MLNALIEERLRFHEIDRFGFEQVPVDDIEKQVAKIRARFPDEATFQKALREVGLDLKGLRQLVPGSSWCSPTSTSAWAPASSSASTTSTATTATVLTPEMQKKGVAVPPVEDVREDIREVLKQQKLTQEIAKWTEELRAKADVVIYPDQPANAPLPPVVKRIETPKKGKEGKGPQGQQGHQGR